MKEIPAIILLLLSCIYACNNVSQPSQQDDIMRKFDSLNQSLQQVNQTVESSAEELYKKLGEKLSVNDKAGSLRQMQYKISDFYGYMSDLKRRFFIASGDSTGTGAGIPLEAEEKMDISNRFFLSNESAKLLPAQLENVQQVFNAFNKDSALSRRIGQLTTHPGKEFIKGWFYNVPPVAALTLLSKFENDVRTIERQLLERLLAE